MTAGSIRPAGHPDAPIAADLQSLKTMLSIFIDILGPVFLIVAVGAVAGRRLEFQPATLSKLSYWLLGPAFIFDVLSDAELAAGLIARMVAAAVLAMVVTAGATWIALRVARRPYPVTAAALMTSVYGNVGNFGLAIVAFTFGTEALPLAGIMFIVINIGGLLVGVTAATRRRTSLLAAVRTALSAPMNVLVAPAIVVNLFDIEIPLWLDRPVSLVAGALIPVMLLTLGMQLSGMARPTIDIGVTVPIVTKLAVAPLAAAVLVWMFGVSGVAAGVVVLQSAMPAAVFTVLVAIEHDLEPEMVTTTVLVGTMGSIATLPVAIALLT